MAPIVKYSLFCFKGFLPLGGKESDSRSLQLADGVQIPHNLAIAFKR